MNKKLRKATAAILGTAVLGVVSTQASAQAIYVNLGTLTDAGFAVNNITGQAPGWNGNNNGYLGWTHSTQWMLFKLSAPTSVEIKAAAKPGTATEKNLLLPAFTIWATDPQYGFEPKNHNPGYSYTANNIYNIVPTHPYNQVQGAPTNLDGQATPVSPGHGPTCPAGGCNSNNWLAPGGGGNGSEPGEPPNPPTYDGITTLVGYANSSPIVGWKNGNGDVVGSGVIGSDNNGPLSGKVDVRPPDWSVSAANTVQYAALQLYNLSAGTYLIAPGGGCAIPSDQAGSDCARTTGFASTTKYNLTIQKITAPVPIPAAVWLFGSALAGLGAFARRKR